MTTTAAAKQKYALALLAVGGLVAVALMAQAGRVLVRTGTGADPADAFNELPALADDLGVPVRWVPDPIDVGRPIEPRTREEIGLTIAQGWSVIDLAPSARSSEAVTVWFTGPAAVEVARGGEGGVQQVGHELRAEFYSDDGTVLTLVDRVSVDRITPDGFELPMMETHRVTLLLTDGNWRINNLERVAVEALPES
jgi:hypothetical protein